MSLADKPRPALLDTPVGLSALVRPSLASQIDGLASPLERAGDVAHAA